MAVNTPLPSTEQKILFGSSWSLLGKIVTAVASIASAALMARLLSPEDLGTYFLIFSIVSTAVVVAQFGLNNSIVRFISEAIALDKHAKALAAMKGAFVLGTIAVMIVSTILILGGNQWLSQNVFKAPQINNVNFYIVIWVILLTFRGLVVGAFQGLHEFKMATIYGDSLTRIFLVILLLVTWTTIDSVPVSTIVGIMIAALTMTVISGGYNLWKRIKSLPRECPAPYKKLAIVSLPFMLTGLMSFILTQADLWIIGVYRSEDEVALYGAAARLVLMVLTPLLIINLVMPAIIAELNIQGNNNKLEKVLRAAATFAGIPAMGVLIIFILIGDNLLNIIYGEYYTAAADILIILSIGKMVQVWSGASAQALAMTGNQNILLLISLVSSCIAIGGGLMVVEQFGTIGVAFFSSLGLAIYSLISVYVVKKRLGVRADIQLTLLNKKSFNMLRNIATK